MKNSRNRLEICENPQHRKLLSELTEQDLRLPARLLRSSIATQLVRLSESLPTVHQDVHATATLLKDACSLFDQALLDPLVTEELLRFMKTPLYQVGAKTVDNDVLGGITLLETTSVNYAAASLTPLSLKVRQATTKISSNVSGVTIQGSDVLLRFLKAGGAKIRLYSATPFHRNSELTQQSIRSESDINVHDEEMIFVEGGSTGISILSCESPVLITLASSQIPRCAVNAHYGPDGHLVCCSATSIRSSRAQLLATLLRELGSKGSIHALEILSHHEDHFLRWHAMREMVALDIDSGRRRIAEAVTKDAHPQVRHVAAQSQAILQEKADAGTD